MPSPRWTASARCCSWSRAWTPRARAGSCATSSVRWIHRACATPPSRHRRRRSGSTRSSGGSAMPSRCPGQIGVFDRSHYEDVLVVRVHDLVPEVDVVSALRPDQRLRGQGRRAGHHDRQGHVAPLPGRAEDPADATAAATGQAVEVQPGRRRRAPALAAVPGGLPGRAGPDLDGPGALVCRAGRPQVVRPAGRPEPRARAPGDHGPAVAGGRLRRHGRTAATGERPRACRSRERPPRGRRGPWRRRWDHWRVQRAEGRPVVAPETAGDEGVRDLVGGELDEQAACRVRASCSTMRRAPACASGCAAYAMHVADAGRWPASSDGVVTRRLARPRRRTPRPRRARG